MTGAMAQLADMLVACGLASAETIHPCNATEVAEVSVDRGLSRLPAQYDEFLRLMGRQAGELLVGTDFFYPRILGLETDGRQLLLENSAFHLFPADAIIIGMHQGYQLYWLSSSGGVSLYTERRQDIDKSWSTLLECLAFEAEAMMSSRLVRHQLWAVTTVSDIQSALCRMLDDYYQMFAHPVMRNIGPSALPDRASQAYTSGHLSDAFQRIRPGLPRQAIEAYSQGMVALLVETVSQAIALPTNEAARVLSFFKTTLPRHPSALEG
jgi:hypothetical protein